MSDKVITYSEFISDIEDIDHETYHRISFLLSDLGRNNYAGMAMEVPGYRKFLVNFCIHLLRKRKVMFCRSKEFSEEAMSVWENGEIRKPLFSAISKYDSIQAKPSMFLSNIDECERITKFANRHGYEYIVYFHDYDDHFLRTIQKELAETHKVISIKLSPEY